MKNITWSDFFAQYELIPVELAWNASIEEILETFRSAYGDKYNVLYDSLIDQFAEKYGTLPTSLLLNGFGLVMEYFGLIVFSLDRRTDRYVLVLMSAENLDFENRWQMQKFMKRLGRGYAETPEELEYCLEHLSKSFDLPAEFIEAYSPAIDAVSHDVVNVPGIGNFMLVSEKTDLMRERPTRVEILDLRQWPCCRIKAEAVYDRDLLAPCEVRFKTADNLNIVLSGSDFDNLSDANEELSEADEDDEFAKSRCIVNGEPIAIDDTKTYYAYFGARYRDNEEVFDSDDDDDDDSETVRRRYRRGHGCILEYDASVGSFRRLQIPNISYGQEIVPYFGSWLMIYSGRWAEDGSYLMRFWNWRTNRCVRVPLNMVSCGLIADIHRLNNGRILFELEDGRLAYPAADLPEWLMQRTGCEIELPDWSKEKGRSFDNFPEDTGTGRMYRRRPFFRRISCREIDRMMITFDDDSTLDIHLRKNV